MRAVLAYAPRPGPLGSARPWIAALYLGPLALAVFVFSSPLVIASAALAAAIAARRSAALAATMGPVRLGLALAVTIVAVNALVSQRGATILLRGWDLPLLGRIDVSAEALAEGGVLALRVLAALIVFAVWSACVDPDRILRGLAPLARRSALTATLIARLVPLAAADASRLSEASRLRGPAAAPGSRGAMARRLIAGSLDRSVDVAATLELRGYGLDRGAPGRRREPRRRGEVGLALAGASMLLTVLLGLLVGAGTFEAYPTVSASLGASTVVLVVLLPLLGSLPFVGGGLTRELERVRAGDEVDDG